MTAVMDAPVLTPAAPKLKPGKVWYWIFGLLTLLSLLAAGAIWLTGRITVENDVKAFARFVAPNEAQLRFKRGGEYLIYYEYAGKVDDTEIEASSTPPGGLELTMRDAQGESIDLRPTPKPLSYDVGGYSGVALRLARIDQPGDFTLSAGPPSLSPFAVAIGRGEPPSADSWNQAAILVGAIGAGLGVIGLIVTALLRRRSRAARTQRQTAAALAAPLDPVAPVAPAAATAAWAAPGDATADPGAVPPPPSVVPPAPVASVVPAGYGAPPPPPPAGDVPPPLAGESVGPTPPLPPPPPGATPPSAFEPAPPPGALAAPPPSVSDAVPPSVSDAVPPSVSDAVPPSVSDAVPPEPPPLPEPSATSEPEAPETSEWAPPAAGSATEPGAQPSPPPPPPPPP